MKPGASWVDVYESLKDDHPPVDRIKGEYQAQMEAAQAFLTAHDIVTLPPGERVITIDTPPAMRRSSPFGTFSSVGPFDKDLLGKLVLTPIEDSLSVEQRKERLRSHHRAWIPIIAVHEAYPGHPLLPAATMVRNDVRLDDRTRLLVVSGSNMSGKSTLLRTVGINVVMALAGAPVRAIRLRLSPLAIGASIHILDSLQTGASRFYAEITRLREIVELTNGPLPLLFLLDEILSGTNSHDRRIGAEAVVRELVERGAIGLVTTHDLALTRIVENLGTLAANVHFEDHLENGKMKFDYKMHPGVVQRSNALELMRAVGLIARSHSGS